MSSPRARFAVTVATLLIAACGGSVVVPGGGSSSGGSSSGSSGSSSSSSGSSSSSSGSSSSGSSSGGSSSGSSSSGGPCVDGQQGPSICPGSCNGGFVPEVCVRGRFTCPPIPPCPPPPLCNGPPPPCACPVNCKCSAQCDPSIGKWTCTTACAIDAGTTRFACGDKSCNAGDVCLDVATANGGKTGPYECLPNPSACAGDYSCNCEENALAAAGTCKPVSCDQTGGNVTVNCYSL